MEVQLKMPVPSISESLSMSVEKVAMSAWVSLKASLSKSTCHTSEEWVAENAETRQEKDEQFIV